MTREEAKKELSKLIFELGFEDNVDDKVCALNMAIKALENIGHLKDRPCSVCEFNKENGCCKWTCVFTDKLFGGIKE